MTQQNPNPQQDDDTRSKSKNRRDRPYILESRFDPARYRPRLNDWSVHGRYRTARERDQALDALARSYPFLEFRFAEDV